MCRDPDQSLQLFELPVFDDFEGACGVLDSAANSARSITAAYVGGRYQVEANADGATTFIDFAEGSRAVQVGVDVEVEDHGVVVLVCAATLHGENYQFTAAFVGDPGFGHGLFRRDGAVIADVPVIAAPDQPFRMELECAVREDGVSARASIDGEVVADLFDTDPPDEFTQLTSVGFILGADPAGTGGTRIWLDNLAVTTE